MDTRSLKTGHWYAAQNTYESFSTGDLYQVLEQIASGEMETPVAVHISPNPIKAMHAYLWTPVVKTTDLLVVSYGQQTVRFEWSEFEQLVEDVETLRANGFRVKDVQSGEPRIRDLEKTGLKEYRRIENRLEKHRGSAFFELVLTASTKNRDTTGD